MKSFFSKNKKKIIAISSIFLFASLFFLYPSVALAEDGENVAKVLGWIIFPFIWIMGQLATLLLGVLIKIAQYNDFINSSAVSYGWVVVRDLCNMFFVLILLIIAFASILRVDSYNLKTWLPKLVIMAVLINFSKLICGIFIDFAQVIMLTFVNAFKDIAGANLTDMLGITKILNFDSSANPKVTAWTIIGSMVLALVVSVIAVVVILSMLAMLAMRIVLIWIYVVLSPIAYLMAAFPQGQPNSQRWWSDFSKNVIVGPILAFFIWLAFASLGGVEGEEQIKKIQAGEEIKSGFENNETDQASQVLTEAGSPDNLIKMIISIGMLLGGLMLAQEMGDRSGAIAGKGLAKLQTMGAGSLKVGKNIGKYGAKRTAEVGLGATGLVTGGKNTQVGSLFKGWSADMKTTRQNKAVKARADLMKKVGMGKQAGAAGAVLTKNIQDFLNVGDKKDLKIFGNRVGNFGNATVGYTNKAFTSLTKDKDKVKELLDEIAARGSGPKYRFSQNNKKENLDDDSGIGSINEFGRNRGNSDVISYNFEKLEKKGIDLNSLADGAYLEDKNLKNQIKSEIVSDINSELNKLNTKKSSGEALSVGENNKIDILETAKKRLESGDNFSLVNSSKKMGVSEAAITMRHEGAHKELDEIRKDNNFVPSKKQEEDEEDLVEFYGKTARDNSVSHKAFDVIAAKSIFEGQKNGLSNNEIKNEISKLFGDYKNNKSEMIVSNLIKMEKDSSGSSVNYSNNIVDNLKSPIIIDNLGKVNDAIENGLGAVKSLSSESNEKIDSVKDKQNLESRLANYRHSQYLNSVKKI